MTAPRPRLATAAFLLLHVVGVAYALAALVASLLIPMAWLFGAIGVRLAPLPFLVRAGLAVTLVLAVREVRSGLRRWRGREPEPDVAVRVRALVYAAVATLILDAFVWSTPETYAGPFRIRFPLIAHFTTAFVYGAYLAWSLLLPRIRRTFPVRLRRAADLLAMNAALVLVLAELSLRALAAVWPSPLLVTDDSPSGIRRVAGRQEPGALHFGFPMNSGGHYDVEFVARPEAAKRIVANIGDSFSYGTVPHAMHYTTVAEQALPGVEIYNLGYSGIGPGEYLYLLEHEALPLKPELVVIGLFVGNDVTDGSPPPSPVRWYDADSYLLAIVWHRLRVMRRARIVDTETEAGLSAMTRDQLVQQWPFLADPMLEAPSATEQIYWEMYTERARAICLPQQGLYEPFFQTLEAMERAVGDIPLVFVLIPEEYQVEPDIRHEVERRIGQPLDVDLAQRTISAWLRARGRPVLDLLPVLTAVEPMADGSRHLYHLRNMHFNARGNEVAGRALAQFVDSVLPGYTAPPGTRVARLEAPAPPTVALPLGLDFAGGGARRFMAAGWYPIEGTGRKFAWSQDGRSVLRVPLPRGGDIRMDLEAQPFAYPASATQRVSVVLNGAVIEEFSMQPGLRRYSVILPAAALSAPMSTLEFNYAWTRTPLEVGMSGDVRRLAVAWYGIDFAPAGP